MIDGVLYSPNGLDLLKRSILAREKPFGCSSHIPTSRRAVCAVPRHEAWRIGRMAIGGAYLQHAESI
jgi:hypothetical protein